jgi:hypothetical protein
MPLFSERKPAPDHEVILHHWKPGMRPNRARFVIHRGEACWHFGFVPGEDGEMVEDLSRCVSEDLWEPSLPGVGDDVPPEAREALVDAQRRPAARRNRLADLMTIREEAALRVLQGFAGRAQSLGVNPRIAVETAFEWADAYCDEMERRS